MEDDVLSYYKGKIVEITPTESATTASGTMAGKLFAYDNKVVELRPCVTLRDYDWKEGDQARKIYAMLKGGAAEEIARELRLKAGRVIERTAIYTLEEIAEEDLAHPEGK